MEWCQTQLANSEQFHNVIFTDECSVQLEQHSKLCFRKKLQPRALKQRPKHPVKVHIWGGISCQGATKIVIFTGIMNAIWYGQILSTSLLPFIRKCYPEGHCLQQHKTPPESPDLNPIENVWGSLKQFLRTQYKPKNLEHLKTGTQQFWATLTPAICRSYINHLHKVMPKLLKSMAILVDISKHLHSCIIQGCREGGFQGFQETP